MYVISKFKDYYDGVIGTMGVDKTIVYERNLIEIEDEKKILKEFKIKDSSWNHRRENHFLNIGYMNTDSKKYKEVNNFIVGFCGKLYLGWKFGYEVKERDERGVIVEVTKFDIIYGYDNAKKHLKSGFWKDTSQEDIDYVLNYESIDMFRTLKSPIFIFDRSKPRNGSTLIINPNLKEYEFYKVVDSFTAFQEIQMFIGGILGIGEKEIIKVEDKYKIPQHGFDKWSFRKESVKKNR